MREPLDPDDLKGSEWLQTTSLTVKNRDRSEEEFQKARVFRFKDRFTMEVMRSQQQWKD